MRPREAPPSREPRTALLLSSVKTLPRVSPEAVPLLPEELRQFHMTDLVDAALAAGRRVGSFPVREYWLDIGQLADYERADADHATHFTPRP